MTPPQFNTWGVKDAGFEKGSKMTQRTSDWTEVLFGDNTRGSNSKVFKRSKIVAQGKACIKFFKVMYELEEKIVRPIHKKVSKDEKRIAKNRKRTVQRRERDKRLRREERQRLETQAFEEGSRLVNLYAANNDNDNRANV